MKAGRKMIGVVLIAGFCLVGAAVPGYGQNEKFAYVDIAKVFDNYEKTKDQDRTLQEAGRKKEEERDALVHQIRQLKDEMVLLNDEAKEKKQGELETKVRGLQDYDQQAKQALGEQRREIVREIFKDIDDTVQRYGERKGLDFIFNEKSLIYHTAHYDATEEILKDLNKSYVKQGKK